MDLADVSRKLERVETKLDSLTDAVSRLAVIEERHLALSGHITRHEERLNSHGHRIRGLESGGVGREVKIDYTSRILWLLVGAAGVLVGLLLKVLVGG